MLSALAIWLVWSATLTASESGPAADPSSILFVENVGQFDPAVRFQARTEGEILWLYQDGLWITLPAGRFGASGDPAGGGIHLQVAFPGSNPGPQIEPFDPAGVAVSYGSAEGGWRRAPAWLGVRYLGLYPGLDLVVRGGSKGWSWHFVANGAESVAAPSVTISGALALAPTEQAIQLDTELGPYRLPPLTYRGAAVAVELAGSGGKPAVLDAAGVRPPPAGLPAAREPGPVFSTFIGGAAWDQVDSMAVDASGASYVTGYTESLLFPTVAGRFSGVHGIDVFIAKLDPAGSALEYVIWLNTTTLNAEDYGRAIAVDASGGAYVAGRTHSNDFCTFLGGSPPGYDPTYNGFGDGYVIKVNPAGDELDYCTYIGGQALDDFDTINALAVDGSGQVYVAGGTWSQDFVTTPGAADEDHNGLRDAFVLKLDAAGAAVVYSTFLGGAGQDEATALTIDGAGYAYVAGWTTSGNFPATAGVFDPDHNGGTWDAFVTKVNPTGTAFTFSGFLGGSGEDRVSAVAVDGGGRLHLAGSTGSADFPVTPGAYDGSYGGDACFGLPCDAFAAAVSADGSSLAYATFLGGSQEDRALALALDGAGRSYVAGMTASSSDFPITPDAFDSGHNGALDGFLVHLNAAGSVLHYASYLGGSADDIVNVLAAGGGQSVFLAGRSQSADFPVTPGSYDPLPNGDSDAFVTLLPLPPVSDLYLPLMLR